MKLKSLSLAALAASALIVFASDASATTLETNGVKQTGEVTIEDSNSGSLLLSATGGGFANTCTEGTTKGKSSTATGTVVVIKITIIIYLRCTSEPVTVDEVGSLGIEAISGTTNGTVRSSGTKVTWPSPFGTVTCTTNNTDIGTLTGVASGTATLDINAVLNCGFFLPSAKWEGKFNLTTSGQGHAIGVVS
jgi:hypothetical protein